MKRQNAEETRDRITTAKLRTAENLEAQQPTIIPDRIATTKLRADESIGEI
jgi:hypothetical protein